MTTTPPDVAELASREYQYGFVTERVEITMSMTAPGCGMGDVLREDAQAKVETLPGVTEVDVEIVWDPPWDLSRLSDEARLQQGIAC